jgi:hypothetical protein
MRRRSLPAEIGRWGPLVRRLDAAAAWINPFLMTIAAMLLIIDLSCGAALLLARLPVTHVNTLPQANNRPPGLVSMAVQ